MAHDVLVKMIIESAPLLPHLSSQLALPIGLVLKCGAAMLGATLLGWFSDRKSTRGEDLEREIQRLRIVFDMATALNATLNYERVLNLALDLSISALADTRIEEAHVKCAFIHSEDGRLHVAAGRGLSQADLRTIIPCQAGLIAAAISTGETTLCQDPPHDPELKLLTAFHTTRCAVCIPLRIGLETYGVLLFGHPFENAIPPERLNLLETIAQQSMIALQNARLYSELEQERQRMMEIHEETRKKLARDLHDGPTQSIAAIAMRVNFARRLVERDPKASSNELFKIEELARRTTKEIRQMLFTLRPLILESRGLVAAIEQLATKMKEAHDQDVIVEADPQIAEGLNLKKQGLVFSIIEEAVNNARKHAQANQIRVRMLRQGDHFLVEVEDNGAGFSIEQVSQDYHNRESLGLINLQERAELLNGLLNIDTSPGNGTKVTLSVPLTEEAAEPLHRPGFAAQNLSVEQASLTN